jgi:hypothetical protein
VQGVHVRETARQSETIVRDSESKQSVDAGARRAELVAAAKALQTWLYDRRSEWADRAPGVFDTPGHLVAAGLSPAVPISIPVPYAPEHEPEMAIIRELAVEASAAIKSRKDRRAALGQAAATALAVLRQGATLALATLRIVATRVWSLREPLGRALGASGRGLLASGALVFRGISAGVTRLGALRAPLAEGADRLGGAASAAGPAIAERVGALREPLVRWSWRVAITAAVVAALAGVGWPALRYWQSLETTPVEDVDVAASPTERGAARGRGTPPAASARGRGPVVTGAIGRLRVESDPVGARVLVDGQMRGVTPLNVDDLRVGTHAVVLESVRGTIRRSVSIRAGATTELVESIFAGWVHVSSPIELQISAGGRGLRLDERNQVLLPPGSHELRFENRAMAFVAVRKVEVEPGKTASISVVPPPSTLSVTSTAPATVLVDGAPIGETPLVDYGINLGIHEITVRNADGAERRFTVTVTTTPVQLNAEF